MIDDDEQVIVRKIAAYRILDPVATRKAAKEDDLEQFAIAIARLGALRGGPREASAHGLDHMRKFALLAFGQMIEAGLNGHMTGVFSESCPTEIGARGVRTEMG